ncbi:MAG: glycosyltransferase family 39 protein [Planctomycetes bacterium]|nr:glycosyltransferase family 39 protein [Planctomycetota bacterium]
MPYNAAMGWIILPLAVLTLFIAWARAKTGGLREAILIGACVWGAAVVAITETLSLFSAITWWGLAVAWMVVGLVAWYGFVLARQKPADVTTQDRLDSFTRASIACLTAYGAVLLLIAIVAPPNTWDAMTYHMGRVIHWAQNRSVAHYPTNIVRQVQLNPFAEFVILHFQILTNGDRFANLPQWLAMVGSVVGVSLIAGRLGAGAIGQALAATACATLPMGILQSTSAQNDYVTAFWLVCLAWCVIELASRPAAKHPERLVYALAASLGLAILTKATAYLFAAPFIIWFVVHVLRTRPAQWWRYAAAIAAIAIAINLGHSIRNYRVFGSPLGPKDEVSIYTNEAMGPARLVSNVLRNLALHANVAPNAIQKPTTNAVASIVRSLGVDPHDPATTLSGTFFGVEDLPNHEDSAGNGLHLVAILAALLPLTFTRAPNRAISWALFAAVVAGFLLFCGYLRWQPWNSRLHLPLFVLAAPLIGSAFDGRRSFARSAIMILLLAGVFPLLFNFSRPLIGPNSIVRLARNDIFYLTRWDVREGHMQLADYARRRGCLRIGMMIGPNEWEYPLWAMLNEARVDGPYKFDHVNVSNATKSLPGGQHLDLSAPDCITTMQVREASEIYGKPNRPAP